MKIKEEHIQPIVLAICVGLFEARTTFSEFSEWIAYCWVAGAVVPGLWIAGLILIAQLIKKKQYKHCVIILCLNIFISSFYDGIFVFTHLGRKTNVYVPYSIQDAKEKGAFICEYKQTNQVVLLDSIDISVDEAFASHLCFYDDKDILHAHPNLHKKDFVASLKNRERLDSIGERYRIYDGFKYTQLSAGKWTKIIEIDSITGALPENLVFRILHYERNEDSVIVDTCIDSICFVRVPERMTN